jgi:hypothetical protein
VLHAEIGRAMLDEHVEFLERAPIEQKLEALARRELAPPVLRRDLALPSPQTRLRTTSLKAFKHLFHGLNDLTRTSWREQRSAQAAA